MENFKEQKMGMKLVLNTWSNANRKQKDGSCWFKEAVLNMVFMSLICFCAPIPFCIYRMYFICNKHLLTWEQPSLHTEICLKPQRIVCV